MENKYPKDITVISICRGIKNTIKLVQMTTKPKKNDVWTEH